MCAPSQDNEVQRLLHRALLLLQTGDLQETIARDQVLQETIARDQVCRHFTSAVE